MANLQPTVLDGIDLQSFIQHLLKSHGASSTLIVGSSKETFLHQLHSTILSKDDDPVEERHDDQPETDGQPASNDPATLPTNSPHDWTTPTLRLLASAQTLRLAFCEDVTHLRAYLAAYPYRCASPQKTSPLPGSSLGHPPTLAILNLIDIHRDTTYFSAQGLNRTFSVAVDGAHKSGSKLVIAECQDTIPVSNDGDTHADDRAANGLEDLWDQEVSILNVATKTFGAGERGWVGRTVKLRAIASRWCVFEAWAKGKF